MRILILGQNGQLGWEAKRSLTCLGNVYSYDYPEVDFTRPQMLAGLVKQHCPQIIFNAVAYTAVDRAEQDHETARLVNAVAPGELAEAALKCGALLIHFSTDYVFDGAKNAPYLESDLTNPLNVYGQTKLDGEKAITAVGGSHLIFRSSWIYSNRRDNFVNKVLEWVNTKNEISIVDDQIGSPTWARSLARIISQVISNYFITPTEWDISNSGIYHLADHGCISRYEWAKMIVALDPRNNRLITPQLIRAKTENFPTPAKRPLFSALDCSLFQNTFLIQIPDWLASLKEAMIEMNTAT